MVTQCPARGRHGPTPDLKPDMLSAYELELEEADDRLLSSRICFNAASRGSPSGSPRTLTEVEEVDPFASAPAVVGTACPSVGSADVDSFGSAPFAMEASCAPVIAVPFPGSA